MSPQDPRVAWAHRVGYWSRRRGTAVLRAAERLVVGPAAHRSQTRPLALRPPSAQPGVAAIVPHLPSTVVVHCDGTRPAPWLPRTTAIDESWTYWITDAEVAPEAGAVWLADRTPVPELVGGIDRYQGSQDVRGLARAKARARLSGTWCVMPRHTYYHFLLEDVPALLASLSAAREADPASVGVVTAADLPRYIEEFLESIGAPVVRTGAHKVRVARLVGTSFTSGARVHPSAVARIRRHFGIEPAAGGRVLYVSRVGFRRSPPWEQQLMAGLRAAIPGLQVVEGHRLGLREQVDAFADASLVVGLHGAGLSNIVFSPPTCRVVEIATAGNSGDHFWRLATQLQQDYRLAWVEDGADATTVVDAVLQEVAA